MAISENQKLDDVQAQWVAAIRAMTSSLETAEAFLNDRLLLTTSIAKRLTDGLTHSAVLYGVWINDHPNAIYIGQTLEGRRRLWDLPIGESHHLANSFPPEIWTRVVVVYWPKLFDALDPKERTTIGSAAASLTDGKPNSQISVIGLGLEHHLQREFSPLFNRRKKKRDGTWRLADWATSSSVGAKMAPHLGELTEAVTSAWNEFATIAAVGATVEYPAGRVVFPQKHVAWITPAAH